MRLVLPGGASPREIGRVNGVRTVAYRPLAGVEESSRKPRVSTWQQLLTWVMKHLPTIKLVLATLGALVGLIGGVLGLHRLISK